MSEEKMGTSLEGLPDTLQGKAFAAYSHIEELLGHNRKRELSLKTEGSELKSSEEPTQMLLF